MHNKILVVSLGPGDPEMITLKGLRALENADMIFCPMTRKGSKEVSRAKEMMLSMGIDNSKIECYHLPMSLDRAKTIQVYESLAQRLIEKQRMGLNLAITAEGDGGFYSSSQYIHQIIADSGVAVERIAGVPAFIDCAALAGIHIAHGDRALEVIPIINSSEELVARVINDAPLRKNLVLMKISQSQAQIKQAISEIDTRAHFHYIENRGREDEFYTKNNDVILSREFPYFSILIIEVQ